MERWVPLFQIFLHSPCPEGEASRWFQRQQTETSAFLSLLEEPTSVLSNSIHSSSRRCIWMQTLPPALQSRVLSFLAIESRRFCRLRLRAIASHILKDEAPGVRLHREYFWVFSAAHNLLDSVSPSCDPEGRKETRDEENGEEKERDFDSIPTWLRIVAAEESPFLPWLPISPRQIRDLGRRSSLPQEEEEREEEGEGLAPEQEDEKSSSYPDLQILSPSQSERAFSLKTRLSTAASSSDVLMMASEIQALCFHDDDVNTHKSLQILSLLELWRMEDEVAAVLLTQLDDSRVSGLLLASIVFPKLTILQSPVSRVLLSAIVDLSKSHQVAATNALFLPLVLLKEGINTYHCDLLSKMIRECLHPSHVSACCQKLLRGSSLKGVILCLPSHHSSISEEPVWTESLFSLFQQILTRGVQLTPDAVDSLVSTVEQSAIVHGKSLKFCNFLLCMISRCPRAAEFHGISLTRVAERTDTFLTKSILSKLTSQ